MIETRRASMAGPHAGAAPRPAQAKRVRGLVAWVARSSAAVLACGGLFVSGLAFAHGTGSEGRVGPPYGSTGPSAWEAVAGDHREDRSAGSGLTDGGGSGYGVPIPPPLPGCPNPPSRSSLERAFRQTVRTFVAHGRARYGYLYRNLTYSYSIVSSEIVDDQATVTIHYSGSVQDRLTRHTIDASGEASADYAWTACHWVNTDISY